MKSEHMWQKIHEAIESLLWTDDPERARCAFAALGQLSPAQCELDDEGARSNWAVLKNFIVRGVETMSADDKREFGRALLALLSHIDDENRP